MLKPLQRLLWHPSALADARTPPVRTASTKIGWLIPNKLAIGRLPKAGDSTALIQANIAVILSLCAEAEGKLPEDIEQNFRCIRYILPDSNFMFPLQVEQLAYAVELIQQTIENQQPVFVHCLASVERSPTVCIAYLCRYHYFDLWEAINCVRQVRPHALPTDSQFRVIRKFLETGNRKA
jgi:protein-tyrosine phosphatase